MAYQSDGEVKTRASRNQVRSRSRSGSREGSLASRDGSGINFATSTTPRFGRTSSLLNLKEANKDKLDRSVSKSSNKKGLSKSLDDDDKDKDNTTPRSRKKKRPTDPEDMQREMDLEEADTWEGIVERGFIYMWLYGHKNDLEEAGNYSKKYTNTTYTQLFKLSFIFISRPGN